MGVNGEHDGDTGVGEGIATGEEREKEGVWSWLLRVADPLISLLSAAAAA